MEPRGDDATALATGDAGAALGMATGDVVAGRYRITRFVGAGGMGNVYAALDTELGEPLAIKMLRRGMSDGDVERFRTEVRLQRRITHRNVARIFDIGEHAGEKFLTMELVDGESLAGRLLRVGRLPLVELHAVVTDVLRGLAAAHAAGVIHLDLKPGNVLLARDGRAVIADFGIARAGATGPGEVAGTPGYMAPEQHDPAAAVDARTDLYAFGALLYELATGARPFAGGSLAAVAAAKVRPLVLAPLAEVLPTAGVAVVQRCLAVSPDERPASADELLAAVDRALGPSAGGSGAILVPAASPGAPAATLAVLPPTAEPGDAYLADGLAEDLADALSRSPGLRVLPATAARGLVATGVAAGAALGVDHVVESSLRRRGGDALRVAVRLVSVRDGFQVWADRRDIAQPELLTTADALALGLAGALSTAAARRDEIDPRAVDLYLRARHALRELSSRSLDDAIAMLEEASTAAPGSPTIVSALAIARVRAWMLTASADAAGLARHAAEQAMATGPFHGEARYARAQVRMNTDDLVGGAHDLGAALALAPLLSDAHYTAGLVLCEIGAIEDGRVRFRHGREIDPQLHVLVEADLARIEALLGDWAAADARLAAMIADARSPHVARLGGLFAARLAGWRGRREAALGVAAAPGPAAFVVDDLMTEIQAMIAGPGLDADRWRAQLAHHARTDRPLRGRLVAMQVLAEVAMTNGEPALARRALETAAAVGLIDVVWLERCPLWGPVADAEWFGAVLAQVAARAHAVGAAYRAGIAGRSA